MVLQHLRLSCVMSVKSHNVLLHLTAFHDANMWLMEKCLLFSVINCLCLPKHCVWTLPWTCCLTYDSVLLTFFANVYGYILNCEHLPWFWLCLKIRCPNSNGFSSFPFKHRYREYTLFPKPDHPPCPNIKPLNSATVAISSWPHQTGALTGRIGSGHPHGCSCVAQTHPKQIHCAGANICTCIYIYTHESVHWFTHTYVQLYIIA